MSQARARPFLMFQGQASEALDLYLSVLPEARLIEREAWGSGEQGPEGGFKRAVFAFAGQEAICFESPVRHAFGFTPSISFFIDCESEDALRALAGRLAEGGAELMPLANYGFSRLFAWINDRFGVSWQLNLP